MKSAAESKLIASKLSKKHDDCNIVLYKTGIDYVTWVEYARGTDYPVGYKAWGHYFLSHAEALADFNARQ